MTLCTLEQIGEENGKASLQCSRCHQRVAVPLARVPDVSMVCRVDLHGPGAEMMKLVYSLGVEPISGCSCTNLAVKMDNWGIEGCKENRQAIIDEMRENYAKYSWLDVIKAAPAAVKHGLVLNPLDPIPGLVDEAVRRAASAVQQP